METASKLRTIRSIVKDIDFEGKSLLSINDLTNDQIFSIFELAFILEPWNRSMVNLVPGSQMAAIFFQPSTRTRMSFETAMRRLGGTVVTEANPTVTSSTAKEESLNDMMKVVSKYANIIVLRHPNEVEAREGVKYSDSPVINGGFGHGEHPTQALLDLYTLWRTRGSIEGAKVCIASPNLIASRTGHSMAYGLARLGARITFASTSTNRMPKDITRNLKDLGGDVTEALDLTQDSFNELISDMDLIYLPGCSAPKGAEADHFKKIMNDYFVRFETLEKIYKETGRIIRITHALPRRAGEMDLRIDTTPNQQYFEAISYSVSIRMALILSIIGL